MNGVVQIRNPMLGATGKVRSRAAGRATRGRAFTLTEMLVVIGVIVIVLALSIPAREVWESRKHQEAVNLIDHLLNSAQLSASVDNNSAQKFGLFFFVDPKTGRQKVWPIEQDYDTADWDTTKFRYVLRDVEPLELPDTMRVLPISTVSVNNRPQFYWTNGQLESETLRDPPDDGTDCTSPSNEFTTTIYGMDPAQDPVDPHWGTQFHRNYFVILFGISGQVITLKERAYIVDPPPDYYDPPPADPSPGVIGFQTHLAVQAPGTGPAVFDHAIILADGSNSLPVYFASTSGVVVYDESAFQNQPRALPAEYCSAGGARFDYLLREGRGLYIQGTTGEIIKSELPEL